MVRSRYPSASSARSALRWPSGTESPTRPTAGRAPSAARCRGSESLPLGKQRAKRAALAERDGESDATDRREGAAVRFANGDPGAERSEVPGVGLEPTLL